MDKKINRSSESIDYVDYDVDYASLPRFLPFALGCERYFWGDFRPLSARPGKESKVALIVTIHPASANRRHAKVDIEDRR
jgi:hypothetical protein